MNNINISNIFSNSDFQNQSNNDVLDVINLVKNNASNTISGDFIINKIKYIDKCDKQKNMDLYELKYNECLAKINLAIDMNITDIFYTIGINYFGYKTYNSLECLNFIQKKLRAKNFETYINSSKEIFISWKTVTAL